MTETSSNPSASPSGSENLPDEKLTGMGIVKWLFSFRGRIPRSTFWALEGGAFVIFAVAGALTNAEVLPEAVPVLLFWLLIGPILAVQVKRWHDLDRSGVWVLINVIPILGQLVALALLGFFPGTPGPNTYGPDPLRRSP